MRGDRVNKGPIFWVVVAVVLIAGVAGVSMISQLAGSKRQILVMQTYTVGRDLIANTNSPLLVGLASDLQTRLSEVLASRTQVACVRLGDEPPPIGDGRAISRLLLTNEVGDGVWLRFRAVERLERFDVLGYWKYLEAVGTPNQTFRSATDPRSREAGSGR
jgi:hypothetical protein